MHSTKPEGKDWQLYQCILVPHAALNGWDFATSTRGFGDMTSIAGSIVRFVTAYRILDLLNEMTNDCTQHHSNL